MPGGPPAPGIGEASSRTINILINKAVKMAGEAIVTVGDAVGMAERTLDIPHKATKTTSKAACIILI